MLAVLAFAPEWTLQPVAARGPEMRILAVVVALAALVLLTLAVLSLGEQAEGGSSSSPPAFDSGQGGSLLPPPQRGGAAVRPLLGGWAPAFWIERAEVVLGAALIASVLGGAATALPALDGLAPWIALGVLALVAAVRMTPWSAPRLVVGGFTAAALLLLGVLVVTGGANFVLRRAVPIAPAPIMAVEAWQLLPLAVVLQSMGIAGALVAGVAVFARMGSARGLGRIAFAEGALFLFLVALLIAYGVGVGEEAPAVLPATLEVFGGVRLVTVAVLASFAWILLAALNAMLQRGAPGGARARILALAGAAAVVVLVLQARVGVIAGLWILAALAWVVPTHGALLVRGIRRVRAGAEEGSFWRTVAHGLATVGAAVAAVGALLFLTACARPVPEKRLEEVRLPDGFQIETWVDGIENPRQMALGGDGTLYVGTKILGKVYAVPDRDGDGRPDEVVELASGLAHSNGVAVRNDTLWIAENGLINRYPGVSGRVTSLPEPELVVQFPERPYHKEAYLRFGPDGALYVTMGSPCDTCIPEHPAEATISRLDMRITGPGEGSGDEPGRMLEVIAEGVRNSMGFDWHPETGELWFTDNGRDWLGDHVPPDEVNRISERGLHFGFPYCHGFGVRDPEFGENVDCSRFQEPVLALLPHVAALGAKFYDGEAFPERYRNALLIAEHGSYNRSDRVGYRITMVTGLTDGAPRQEPFAEGFIGGDGRVWARPADLLVLPDGSLLMSDDHGDAIYRISYDPGAAG